MTPSSFSPWRPARGRVAGWVRRLVAARRVGPARRAASALATGLALFAVPPAACALLTTVALLGLPAAAVADTGGAGQFENPAVGRHSPFARQGMWIWYIDQSQGGSVPAIIAEAKSHGIGTVYIKAGDGTTPWSQFDSTLVEELHRGGLKVCAWQFVYGDAPVAEARIGAAAVADGADCLVIDAEAQYEGKYAAADLYLDSLRAAIGANFPLSLAGFPYVDYHPAFPYSVFLGPGGATVNQPQMYWKAIGTSVRRVFEHTYLYNRLWGRPIFPIGQTYEAPGRGPLRLFRRYAASYGAAPSWWDWQETTVPEWGALGSRSAARKLPGFTPTVEYPLLKIGAKGDLVVWAQERLITAGDEVEVNGIFEGATRRAVRAFQEVHGLPGDGRLGSETWAQLLDYTPFKVEWDGASTATASTTTASTTTASSLARGERGWDGRESAGLVQAPLSASLPAKRDELRGPRRDLSAHTTDN